MGGKRERMFHVKQNNILQSHNYLIMNNKVLLDNLRAIPDFPKKGINFRDVTTLYKNAECVKIMLDELEAIYKDKGITKIVGIESRGFVMASALAGRLGCGIVLARKPGKLPSTVIKESFSKEYGVDTVEMHIDSIEANDVVLIHDDLLATGGTVKAVWKLVQHFHPKQVYINFIIEIRDEGLHGRDLFDGIELTTLLTV
jgi:adenine phosphoribosyltransferase